MRSVGRYGLAMIALSIATTRAALPGGATSSDWPMLAHDAARSGATPAEIRPPFERKWYRIFPEEGLMAGVQPVVAGGRVFVGTLAGIVCAIDAETGEDVWTYEAGGPVLHACAVAEGKVFFGAANGILYGVNAGDGSFAWKVETGAAIWNAPAVYGGLVVIGSRDGRVYAVEAKDGRVKWTAPTSGPLLCSPAVDPKARRVYIGSEDMHVYAFDLDTGRRIWRSAKLPGVSFRGYHPVVAPDGSVMITVAPCAPLDHINPVLHDMVKEIFGDFSNWRHTKEENARLRKANLALLEKPDTYQRELDYIRKRLTDQPALRTFFVLDPADGRHRFVAPIVYAESMNGTAAPPLVTPAPDARVIVKYRALLCSRYEHYSPFLNVGYLDTKTGHITPIMDQTRTYGWHDSLLLVHDEQCQLAIGGRVLFNTHQDNVNAMDLDTLKGYGEPLCRNVHEVKPGVALGIWTHVLRGTPIPVGWEWIARGTAVYGGGSAIDVPISIAGDSFYYVPSHEMNAGCSVIAYKMKADGTAGRRRPEPGAKLTGAEWKKILAMKWDWDTLESPRLNHVLKSLPGKVPGTRQQPLTETAKAKVAEIPDADLDRIILQPPAMAPADERFAPLRAELARAVEELIAQPWRPLLFPAGKHPREAYWFFVEPTETLYTLALAYPHLPPALRKKVKAHVDRMRSPDGPLSGPTGKRSYEVHRGSIRSAYDPAPEDLLKVQSCLTRSEPARLYPLWLWARATNDWDRLEADWPQLRKLVNRAPDKDEPDLGNGRIAGLIAACRIARQAKDEAAVSEILPLARQAMRARLEYELSHTEGGLIVRVPTLRGIFGRWRHLTPDVARLCRNYAGDIHRRLMDVYVDHHRPTWWIAWTIEHMWRNETAFAFPSAAMEVFTARALILREPPETLARFVDIPWCKADEYYIQKIALVLTKFDD